MPQDVVWIAVRCCCKPTKVFGFIKQPVDRARRGYVRLMKRRESISAIVNLNSAPEPVSNDEFYADVRIETMSGFENGELSREIAIYSEDRPIEFWRTIEGFVEAAVCDCEMPDKDDCKRFGYPQGCYYVRS